MTSRLSACLLFTGLASSLFVTGLQAQVFSSNWVNEPNRVWIGADFWANRLQDWRIQDGRLECVAQPNLPMRTAHLLSHRLNGSTGQVDFSIQMGAVRGEDAIHPESERGVLFGAGKQMDYRAAALIHQWAGPGGGMFLGVDGSGRLFLRDNETGNTLARAEDTGKLPDAVELSFQLKPAGENFDLIATAKTADKGELLCTLSYQIPGDRIAGNIALVSNALPKGQQAWFRQLKVSGKGLRPDPTAAFGPIACTQYTLSFGVLKMTAQLLPVGDDEPRKVYMEIEDRGEWRNVGEAELITPGWTATFRVPDWDDTKDTNYRVVYGDASWDGTIGKNPTDKSEIVVAGFTGNHNNSHAIGRKDGPTDWRSGIWFPHADVTAKVRQQQPDVLFFSGDQVYESKSPTFADRNQILLDYLYKWYLWCWAYRDLTRDIVTVTIPDDHDVYQGNIWGEGGRPTHVDNAGGYVHPADFVQMVHRTQTNHLPDPFDPEPVAQDIPVYYTALNYGGVSFAILEDRKWKSGCAEHGLPPSGTGRPDHFNNPDFNTRQLDLPNLELLGERQLKFLDAWATDWRQCQMKVALSQTIFANLATHHGANLDYLMADLDSNGWPQSGRNRALEALRKAFALHLAGDQHLATVAHQGIERHGDAVWSFCVPSIANFYPRMWNPRREGLNRPDGAPHWQGDHLDGFLNLVTVRAATNPGPDFGVEPKELHNGMAGYGIVRINKPERTYTMECWPRFADPKDPEAQYEGWPVTVGQRENYGREPQGYLSPISVEGLDQPVVEIRHSDSGELVYALRIQNEVFTPWVFEPGHYNVRIGDPDLGIWSELKGIEATLEPYSKATLIEF